MNQTQANVRICASVIVICLGAAMLAQAESASSLVSESPSTSTLGENSSLLTPAQAQADFDVMREVLEEAHPGLYRYSTKSEMDQNFDRQRAHLNHPLTRLEFMRVVAETLAAIHCGHTSCEPDEETQKAWTTAKLLPLRVVAESNRLVVLLNDTAEDQTIRPGMELLAINRYKTRDILDRIWRTESADGDILTGKSEHVSGQFGRLYYWLIDQTDVFVVKARDASGNILTTSLAGVTDQERKGNHNPLNTPALQAIGKLRWSPENAAVRFLKDPEIAEIRLHYFVGEDFPHWVEQTFKSFSEKHTKALIIDLRGNGGGEDAYGALLVSYLTDKPFRYIDRVQLRTISPSAILKAHSDWPAGFENKLHDGTVPNPSGGFLLTPRLHPGLSEQAPGRYPFLGKVFVLTDGGTFSTAADFCAVTRHLRRATFIGEETAGAYYGNNSGLEPRVTLPNSKLRVRLPMYEYWNAVSDEHLKRRGTIPDHLLETKAADLLQGIDAQLNLAFKLAGSETSEN